MIRRRDFLVKAATLSAGVTVLAACATPVPNASAPAAAPARGSGVQLPSYIPVVLAQPDLPATAAGVDPGYLTFPKTLARSVSETPSKGGDVNVFTFVILAAPPPVDQNPAWQAINKAIGANVKINMVPSAEYSTKLATTIAGNDIPDLLFLTSLQIQGIPQFLEKSMVDLTPYVGGDAVKDYPNLANLPTIAWKQMVFDNTLYGIPCSNSLYLWAHWVQQDLLDAEGLSQPRNADEYKQLAMHFTRPDQGLYGLGVENNVGMGMTNGWMTGIFATPNMWSLEQKTGKLTGYVET